MIVTDEDVYVYLEHHGVKGMRWGSRKAKKASDPRQYPKAVNSSRRRILIGTTLATGATYLLGNKLKLKQPIRIAAAFGGGLATEHLLEKHYDKKLSTILDTNPNYKAR
jgi:hypothetical protein